MNTLLAMFTTTEATWMLVVASLIIWLGYEMRIAQPEPSYKDLPLPEPQDTIWNHCFKPFELIVVDGEYEEFVLN